MKTYIIDRIEDGIAVLECLEGSKEVIEMPRKTLPKGVKEGQVLCQDESGYTIDHEATAKRRTQMRERLNRLLKKK